MCVERACGQPGYTHWSQGGFGPRVHVFARCAACAPLLSAPAGLALPCIDDAAGAGVALLAGAALTGDDHAAPDTPAFAGEPRRLLGLRRLGGSRAQQLPSTLAAQHACCSRWASTGTSRGPRPTRLVAGAIARDQARASGGLAIRPRRCSRRGRRRTGRRFVGAEVNTCKNVLDVHLKDRSDQVALIYER
jgi:hypothetical protein